MANGNSGGLASRREVLATFLGAAAALAACRRRSTPRYRATLVGPDHLRGHRTREEDLARLASVAAPEETTRVVVVGAGPSGLSTAWRLIHGGLTHPPDLVVLELEDAVGGTSRGGESPVGPYPWGAHYVPVPSSEAKALVALLEELGVVQGREPDGTPIVAEEVLCRAPEERLFHRGLWYEGLFLAAGARAEEWAELRAFRKEVAAWAARRDGAGRRAFVIPTMRASDDADVLALDDLSMKAWLDARGFRSKRLRWLVDYACRDDYGLSAHEEDGASAWAGLFYFASRLGQGGRPAPLMTWPDGNGRLVRHLASKAGGRVRTGCTVVDVAARPDRKAVVTYLDRGGAVRRLIAERVVVALPRFVARRVVSPLRTRLASSPGALPEDEQRAFDYGAWAVANLHLTGRPESQGVPFAWDNVLYESPSLGYVVATHQTGRDHGPTIWTWYYALTGPGKPSREKLLSASPTEWSDVAFSDLASAHPDLFRHAAQIDVFRWGHGMVRPRVGARRALLRTGAARPEGPIHFAHTDLSGVALFEEAHDHGVRAAEEVLAALGLPFEAMR